MPVQKPEWADPLVTSKNRALAHVPLAAYPDLRSARHGDRLASKNILLLNGKWKFQLTRSPAQMPEDFLAKDLTGEAWRDPATLDAINGWVAEATEGEIETILEQLDPEQVALLLNAIYFDGAWTTEFDPDDTRPRAFTRADGSTVEVEMMSISDEEFPLAWSPEYAAAELPYGGGAFTMVIVVPSGDARSFAAGLDEEGWDGIVESLSPTEVDALSIPRLSLTWDGFLNDALKAMGMEVAFGGGADFSGMSPVGDQLCIDFVRQKTFLEVDERGTRAAAVTAVGIGFTSFTGLIADRPFLFAIRERLSGTLLFTGLVGDPTAEDPGPDGFVDTCG